MNVPNSSYSRLKLTGLPILHERYTQALSVFGGYCRAAPPGMVLALVGPTQVGKSLVFAQILEQMRSDMRMAREGTKPLIYLQIETTQQGRVKPKWLAIQMLKRLGHPAYMHIGDMDEREHYSPSRGRDEDTLRIALQAALDARETKKVALDETHLLTRTKDPKLRGDILESLKSIAAIERTLILCGGYEIACLGLFDNAHFAGRTVVYDFASYENSSKDLEQWELILSAFSNCLPLSRKNLLMERAEAMLMAANGSVGLLEKWLWACKVRAESNLKQIDLEVLRSCAPSVEEQYRISTDINSGKMSLQSNSGFVRKGAQELESIGNKPDCKAEAASETRAGGKSKPRPFQQAPKRAEMAGLEIFIDE